MDEPVRNMKYLIVTMASALIAMLAASAVTAGELQQSARFEYSNVRLLAGASSAGQWSAGVEIGMAPGWKTYWRVPGDAGVPPHFEWKGSTNLDKVEIDWPAPKRYYDEAGESIGYKDQVVFPMTVTPKDPAKPVRLVLDLFYAVCKDICIPGSAKLAMTLADPAGSPADVSLIAEYRGKVPARTHDRIKIEQVAVEDYDNALVLAVKLTGGDPASRTDIFVEGSDEIYFRKPKLAMEQASSKIYHLKIDGAKSANQLKGLNLTLTIVDEAGAVSGQTTIN